MLYLKHLDNILDQTANSGGFKYTLRALLRASGMTAFAFYKQLTQWWVKAGFYPQTHNDKGVAAILKQFIEENYVEQQTELLEILRFDVFCEIPQWRPEWLKWQTEAIFEVVSAFGVMRKRCVDIFLHINSAAGDKSISCIRLNYLKQTGKPVMQKKFL